MKPHQPRRAYLSDLSEAKWLRLTAILQRNGAIGRPRVVELREIVNAICYRMHTKCSWRMLPHDFPHWQTVYTYYTEWNASGLLAVIKEVVHPERVEAFAMDDFPATLPFEAPADSESSNGQHNLSA